MQGELHLALFCGQGCFDIWTSGCSQGVLGTLVHLLQRHVACGCCLTLEMIAVSCSSDFRSRACIQQIYNALAAGS